MYPQAFAEASHDLDVVLGGVNTAVLIGSSLTMAMAVWAAQLGKRSDADAVPGLTIGARAWSFLGIKAVEYSHKFEHDLVPGRELPLRVGARPAATRSCSSRSTS